jgi:hypothetical protein
MTMTSPRISASDGRTRYVCSRGKSPAQMVGRNAVELRSESVVSLRARKSYDNLIS